MRKHIQYWNQPEEPMPGPSYGHYWNPKKGNVRVGKQEVKWYNLFSLKKL